MEVMVIKGSAEEIVHYFRNVKVSEKTIKVRRIVSAEKKTEKTNGHRTIHARVGRLSRLFQAWTKKEDKQLITDVLPKGKGFSLKQRRRCMNKLCAELKRTPRSIKQRYSMLAKRKQPVVAS